MIGRDRRYGGSRQLGLKAKAGIAAAVLVGGGAIGVAAAASSHSPTSASNAGYQWSHHHQTRQMTQAQLLAQLLGTTNQATILKNLANLTTAKNFVQLRVGRQVFAAQRGAVVLATRQFIILQSANGQLNLWLTSRNTHFTNATTAAQTQAITANAAATNQAMVNNNMMPAVNAAANVNLVNQLVAPATTTRTVTVNVAGTGVTVTVTVTTNNTATVNTMNGGHITARTTFNNLLGARLSGMARNQIVRGDIAVIAGVRAGRFLQARTVVFTAATTAAGTAIQGAATAGGTTTGGTTTNGAPAGQHT